MPAGFTISQRVLAPRGLGDGLHRLLDRHVVQVRGERSARVLADHHVQPELTRDEADRVLHARSLEIEGSAGFLPG